MASSNSQFRTIPLDKESLGLLAALQKRLPATERISKAERIARNLINQTPPNTDKEQFAASFEYLVSRLVRGLLASHGGSRLNFAFTLSTLLGAAEKSQLSIPTKQGNLEQYVFSVLKKTCSLDKSKGDSREKCLAILSCTAALVIGGTKAKETKAGTTLQLLSLLSSIVYDNDDQWVLGEAAAQIVKFMLTSGFKFNESCDEVLKNWSKNRKKFSSGLAVTLLLRKYRKKSVPSNYCAMLYGTTEGYSSALANDGSSKVRAYRTIQESFSDINAVDGDSDSFWSIPTSWDMIIDMVVGRNSELNITFKQFWAEIVEPLLVLNEARGTKKGLALKVILRTLSKVTDPEDYKPVLSRNTAALLISMATLRKIDVGSSTFVGVLREKNDESVNMITKYCTYFFFRLRHLMNEKKDNTNSLSYHIAEWLVQNSELLSIPGELGVECIKNADRSKSRDLLRCALENLVNPGSKQAVDQRRIKLLDFMCQLAEAKMAKEAKNFDKQIAGDVVQIFALYGAFVFRKSDSDGDDDTLVDLEARLSLVEDNNKKAAGRSVRLKPTLEISNHVAEHAVSCALRLLTSLEKIRSSAICETANFSFSLLSSPRLAVRAPDYDTNRLRAAWCDFSEYKESNTTKEQSERSTSSLQSLAESLALVALMRGNREASVEFVEDALTAVTEYLGSVAGEERQENGSEGTWGKDQLQSRFGGDNKVRTARLIRVLLSASLLSSMVLRHFALQSFEAVVKECVDTDMIDTYFEELEMIVHHENKVEEEEEDMKGSGSDEDGVPLTAEQIARSKERMGIIDEEDSEASKRESSPEPSNEHMQDDKSDSVGSEVGINLDDEDPATLAKFDSQLSSYFRLLVDAREEKRRKAVYQTLTQETKSLSRVFVLLNALVRTLRINKLHVFLMAVACRLLKMSLSLSQESPFTSLFSQKVEGIVRKQLDGSLTITNTGSFGSRLILETLKEYAKGVVSSLRSMASKEDNALPPKRIDTRLLCVVIPPIVSFLDHDTKDHPLIVDLKNAALEILKCWRCLSVPIDELSLQHFARLLCKVKMVDSALEIVASGKQSNVNFTFLMAFVVVLDQESKGLQSTQVWAPLQDRIDRNIILDKKALEEDNMSPSIIRLWLSFIHEGIKRGNLNADAVSRSLSSTLMSAEIKNAGKFLLRRGVAKVFGRKFEKQLSSGRESKNECDTKETKSQPKTDRRNTKSTGRIRAQDLVRREALKRKAEGWTPGEFYKTKAKILKRS